VGSTQECEISITDLATMIWKMVNGKESSPRVKYIPYSDFGKYEDVMARIPDMTSIRELIGFSPVWGLEEGLRKTIGWQRRIMGL
jgi:nucleoside-diphosphate-sugar epimerase